MEPVPEPGGGNAMAVPPATAPASSLRSALSDNVQVINETICCMAVGRILLGCVRAPEA